MEAQESQLVHNIFSLLTEAGQWTDLEATAKVSSLLDTFSSFLKSAPSPEEGVQATRLAFGSVLPHLQVDRTAFNFFCVVFSFLKPSHDSFLQRCSGKDASASSDTIKLLQQCCTVSECCKLALQFLLPAEKIAVEYLSNLPPVFLNIVSSSLTHCKQSETIYNGQLEQVQDSLSGLYQLTVEVAVDFANLLSRLKFDPLAEDDLEILTEVCDKLCTTAACLSQLSEVRGSVTLWRAYTSLIQQYHGVLITRLNLSLPMTALVKEIKDGLDTLASLSLGNNTVEEKDKKIVQRIIKMTSFCLKVVIVMCEKFHGYLMDCHTSLMLLILLLYRFSPKNVVLSDYPEGVKKDLELQVTIGIEPLLAHLRDDEGFIEEVLKSVQKEVSIVDDWGCHILLLIAVLFPLRSSITHHMNTIVSRIFQATEKGHASLSFPCMMDGVMCKGKPLSAVTLYEHTVMHLCAAVATFDCQQFESLERELVHWLFSGEMWPSLLAADVWCFIARYGTSELCRAHCTYLVEVLSQTHTAPLSIQQLVTVTLLSRLMGKLSQSHKEDIMSRINATRQNEKDRGMWCRLIQDKPEEEVQLVEFQSCMEDFIQHVNIITSRTATAEDVKSLIHNLQETELLLEAFPRNHTPEDPVSTNFLTSIALLWTRLPLEYIGCLLVEKLVCSLLKISSFILSYLSSSQLLQILSVVKEGCLRGSVTVKVSLCDFMISLGQCSFSESPHLHPILSIMSDVLSNMIKDENPLIHQHAIDAFVAVGIHTSHEEVLPMCLAGCGKETRERVTLYLQQTPHPTNQTPFSLLHYQSIRMQQKDLQKKQDDVILIMDQMKTEKLKAHCQNHEEVKAVKRRRESISPDEKILDINRLLDSLKESCNLVKRMKGSNVFIANENSKMVKDILENMLIIWTTGEL
ncbi:FIGNL1-interacting regulator of recombination and mitosis-like [Scylla paramamosain]|uniref:FIGNL1-interacting regulator of recombination and mitosis-like n=1 Tax=Scylla paramamosain TaxID=85552 RepID=UPI00308274CA